MRTTEQARREIHRNTQKSAELRWKYEHNDEMSIAAQIQKDSGCSRGEALREAERIVRKKPLFP